MNKAAGRSDTEAGGASRNVSRRRRWPRWLGNVILVPACLLGLGLVLYPGFIIPMHQTAMGVVATVLALAALVFLNAGRSGILQEFLERNRLLVGAVTLLIGFAVALVFTWEHPDLKGVGVLGIIVLLTTILAARLFDPHGELSHRHVRTAIAISCIATFYALVAFANDDPLVENSVLSATFKHFWQVLIAVIGFYFSGVTVEAWADRRRMPEEANQLPSGER